MRQMTMVWALVLAGCDSEFNISDRIEPPPDNSKPRLEIPVVTERSKVPVRQAADVLFVIDITPTMIDIFPVLYGNMPVMMGYFVDSELDYHVGVTSTDKAHNGRLFPFGGHRWVTPETPDPVAVFESMVSSIPMGSGAPSTESGIATAYMALELQKDAVNEGFLRDNTPLHIIAISDEDDQSCFNPFGGGCNPISRADFIDYLNDLKISKDQVTFSSIVCMPGEACLNRGGSLGTNYIRVTDAVGGITWSVDDPDYTDVLEQLSFQVLTTRSEFFLRERPNPDTLEVWVEDGSQVYDGVNIADFDSGRTLEEVCEARGGCSSPFPYRYDMRRNSIRLIDFQVQPSAEIFIRFEPAADARTDENFWRE